MILFGKKKEEIDYEKEIRVFILLIDEEGNLAVENIDGDYTLPSILVHDHNEANQYFEKNDTWKDKILDNVDLLGKAVLYTEIGLKKTGYFYTVEVEDTSDLEIDWKSPVDAMHLIQEEHQVWGIKQFFENGLDL